jgi:glycosyltransferase involved in cell wall biosynthesis
MIKFDTSQKKQHLSVILPTYNEEENIILVITKLQKVLLEVCSYEILIVDDGSTDHTSYLIRTYAKMDSRVRVISHHVNKGYGSAVSTGLRNAKGDFIFFSDSDGQFDFTEIPHFLSLIQYTDIVIGYRLTREDPFHRKLNSYLWTKLNNRYFHLGVRDLNCAFKLFRRDFIQSLRLDVQGASINAVILTQARENGLRIIQSPVRHYPRFGGQQTGANPIVIFRALGEFIDQIT